MSGRNFRNAGLSFLVTVVTGIASFNLCGFYSDAVKAAPKTETGLLRTENLFLGCGIGSGLLSAIGAAFTSYNLVNHRRRENYRQ